MKQPNILVFLTDDHGQWAAGCYGNSEIQSPSMDYLAKTGVRMARAFTPTPVCSPARASFFTGRLASQHGIHDWIFETTEPGSQHPGLVDQTNIGHLLQNAGYQTGLIGKWHCGESWTPQSGFDRWFSYGERQYPHKGEIKFSDQGEIIDYTGFQTRAFTDRSIDFIRERDQTRPFFLTVGYVDTHGPFSQHPERLVESYRDCSFQDIPNETFSPCHGSINAGWPKDPDQNREQLAQYYAAVTFIDQQMGRIIDELEGTGDLDNTLVVYTADHGLMTGHHGLNSKGNATIPQNFIDTSILVPCLFSWKDQIPAGQVHNQMVDHCDLFATLLDAADAVPDESKRQEINSPGESYLPMLKGENQAWRDAYFGEYGNARVVRTDNRKFIKRYPGPNSQYHHEFYDLEIDPRERENRIHDTSYEDEIKTLSQRLDTHFAKYELAGCSGKEISLVPKCNPGHSPWEK